MASFSDENGKGFSVGFYFAQRLFANLGFKPDRTTVQDQLREVANGDITLWETPTELNKEIEEQSPTSGNSLREFLKADILKMASENRSAKDAFDQECDGICWKRISRRYPKP